MLWKARMLTLWARFTSAWGRPLMFLLAAYIGGYLLLRLLGWWPVGGANPTFGTQWEGQPSHHASLLFATAAGISGLRSGAANSRISFWHDVPLYGQAAGSKAPRSVSFVCEIPAGTRAKVEVQKEVLLNPMRQDTKKGAPRFYPWASLSNYGALPQTYEHPGLPGLITGKAGDGDPLDVLDLDPRQCTPGEVYTVRLLGALGMVDGGATDWKLLAAREGGALVASLDDLSAMGAISLAQALRAAVAPDSAEAAAAAEAAPPEEPFDPASGPGSKAPPFPLPAAFKGRPEYAALEGSGGALPGSSAVAALTGGAGVTADEAAAVRAWVAARVSHITSWFRHYKAVDGGKVNTFEVAGAALDGDAAAAIALHGHAHWCALMHQLATLPAGASGSPAGAADDAFALAATAVGELGLSPALLDVGRSFLAEEGIKTAGLVQPGGLAGAAGIAAAARPYAVRCAAALRVLPGAADALAHA